MVNLPQRLLHAASFIGVLALISAAGPRTVGSIKGTIQPADAVLKIKGRSALDSFVLDMPNTGIIWVKDVKPGTYTLHFLTRPPYKPFTKQGIAVRANDTANLGDIVVVESEAK